MEVAVGAKLQYPSLVGSEVFPGKSSGSLLFPGKFGGQQRLQVSVSAGVRIVDGHRSNPLAVSCSYNNYAATTLNSDSPHIAFDEALVLKKLQNKSQEIEPYLSGRCVYLVGMMGSGKTTVGKILSHVLDYSFFDSDTLVEQEVNGKSVAEIFKHHGEGFFRDKETEVLQNLSLMHRLVVSTGGGAVIRPINWKYMQKGVSVWLDVPLVALAKRIAAVGTNSRPLLHHESGDAYSKIPDTFNCLAYRESVRTYQFAVRRRIDTSRYASQYVSPDVSVVVADGGLQLAAVDGPCPSPLEGTRISRRRREEQVAGAGQSRRLLEWLRVAAAMELLLAKKMDEQTKQKLGFFIAFY